MRKHRHTSDHVWLSVCIHRFRTTHRSNEIAYRIAGHKKETSRERTSSNCTEYEWFGFRILEAGGISYGCRPSRGGPYARPKDPRSQTHRHFIQYGWTGMGEMETRRVPAGLTVVPGCVEFSQEISKR